MTKEQLRAAPETPAEARARLLREQAAHAREALVAKANANSYQPTSDTSQPTMRQDEAVRLARRDPDSLSHDERARLARYLRDGVVGGDDGPGPSNAPGARLPLAAKIVLDPERTVYGKMWETDLDAIERKPFFDRPWLTGMSALVAKHRPKEVRDEISAACLITLGVTMARLWHEGKSVCNHSWSYIARRAGLCRDTVRRGLAWYRRHGLLVGMNVLVRPDGATTGPEERVANVYLPKLPEEGPPELSLPTPDSPAAKASVIERVQAEIGYIARFCRGAIVTAWGINIRRASGRARGRPAPA